MTVLEDLIATRKTLVERGRCTASLTQENGKVCLYGAVGVATIPGFENMDRATGFSAWDALAKSTRAQKVIRALYDQLPLDQTITWQAASQFFGLTLAGAVRKSSSHQPIATLIATAVWMFNDWIAENDDEVFAVVDKAILAAGGSL